MDLTSATRIATGNVRAPHQAAQRPERFSPGLAARPGWSDRVLATLRWAWCGQGRPPIELPEP